MKKTKERRRSRHVVSAPVKVSPNAGECQEPVPAWDRRTWLVAVPLALISIAAFIPVLNNGFVDWDDAGNFLNNPYYRGLGWAQLKWAWTTFWFGVYQPLAWLLFEAQYAVWGLDPRGYHLISLVLHAANAVVLYALTLTVLVCCRADSCPGSPWARALGAGLATALFAVHPLRVEAVAWVSCQPYLSCALFFMLAVLAYLRAYGEGSSLRWGWLMASFILFAAALLCHAVPVTLPAVLLILDVYPLRRLGGGPGRWFGAAARKVWWEKVPFILLSLIFMGLAMAARKHVDALVPIPRHEGISARIAQACYAIWFYIIKTVLPLDITMYYPLPERIDWFARPFLLSILGTLALSAALFHLRRRWPGLLAAWLSYLVILAPNSGLIPTGSHLVADRYSYMAMLGGVMLAAAGLCQFRQPFLRARPVILGIITVSLGALLGLIFLTWDQCRIWRTSDTLWTHALNHGASRSSKAHNGLGMDLARQGKLAEASAHYAEALRLNPGFAYAHNNLGTVLLHQGKFAEALAHYAEAVRLNPRFTNAHYNLGVVLSRQGKFAEALAHYAEAVRLNPDFAEAHNNRAMIQSACPEAKYRDGKKAVESATRACDLTEWKMPDYLDTLAAACAEAGDFDAAVAWQTRTIESLTDERAKEGCRSRLALYRARKPYRESSSAR